MSKPTDDDLDLPDRPAEPDPPLPPVMDVAEPLQLGPAMVKPFGKSWAEQHGPQPPTVGMRIMDFAIMALFAVTVVVLFKACAWALFS
jgi:hypothetical protein